MKKNQSQIFKQKKMHEEEKPGLEKVPSENAKKKPKAKKKKNPKWTTATMAAGIGRRQLLAATFKEIIFHLMSLVFLSVYIFGQANDNEFYLTEAMNNVFETDKIFPNIDAADKFWAYMENEIMDAFYGSDPTGDGRLTISNENVLLGVPRLRQVKVSNTSCEIHGYFRRMFIECYDAFGYWAEDKESFGLRKPTAWTFSDISKTNSVRHWGILTSYSGGGFYVDMAPDQNKTAEIFKELKDNFWITRGTRAIFLDFSVYNANLNLFCICKLTFEFLPPGGITTSSRFTTATLTPFTHGWYWTLRILLYLFCVYALYCSLEELREMCYFKGMYFLQFWNYVDNIVILLTCFLVASTEYLRVKAKTYIEEANEHPSQYGNLEEIRLIYQAVQISGAVLLFFVYLRTFKFLNFNRRMAQLNNTIKRCAMDILGFCVMFFVAYFAYAELGYLVFGSEVDDFRSFGEAMFTLLRTILGDFDYGAIRQSNWIIAPIYFLSFIILVFFVLLNMFLAIINDTYVDVKTDIAIAPKEIEMSDYISSSFRSCLRRIGCKIKQAEEERLIDTSLSEIRDALKRCGFEDREIEMYFEKYDIDPLKDLKKQDIEKFYELFAAEDVARQKGEENVVTWKDFKKQDDKLIELENSIVLLAQGVQDLLHTIESLQGNQLRPMQI
ncbi:polycystic kidney disease 2-like 2 protein [Anthonomus grandis grandis]|uniref:polycystic kidney disease 2-like 2 protein n=1 Tax=Anthonomus grandis grandis TaxID=2921223 RepID=UPI002166453C|nr:polycystic kidney disease 2-like 2 protein [Anthonomus grandis grandis]